MCECIGEPSLPLRAFAKRNSRSMSDERATSMISSESSVTGSSASICCFRMRSTWWKEGVSEVMAMSERSSSEWISGRGYQARRVISPVRCRLTYSELLVKVCSLPQMALRKGPKKEILIHGII